MSPRHHDVVVIGGGNAGISLAARLRRDGCQDLAVVEPKTVHEYRPLLSFVAGGTATLDDLRRPQAEVIPPGCRWYRDRVTAVEPARSLVHLSGGETLHYTDLVVCPGSRIDWDAVPGAEAAMRTPFAATSYEPELAPRAWEMLSALTSGRAVFAISARHVPCAPVGLKPLFMAADHWRRTGVLGSVDVELLVEGEALVGQASADERLRATAEDYGVHVRTGTTVDGVDPDARTLRVTGPDGPGEVSYDAFFLAPPYRAHEWVEASDLAAPGSDGFVAVDPRTLQHRTHANVWGLGDAATVDTLPSGGALRRQVPVVADNIAARRTGDPMRDYDGYTVAPVTTSRRRLLLAEFDREGRAEPTIPWPDLVRPRRSVLLFDRYLEKHVYWHQLLKGRVS